MSQLNARRIAMPAMVVAAHSAPAEGDRPRA
jgi:hypothetical protein